MINKIKVSYLFFIGVCIFALFSCNSDIFLDGPELPETVEYSVEGDGGEIAFDVPLKNLEYFGFDHANYKCYNSAGEPIASDSPAREIRSIVYETDFEMFKLERDGGRFTFRSICNTQPYPYKWTLRLEYGHGAHFIVIEVLPGKPLRLLETVYSGDMVINDRAQVVTHREGFTNNGPLTQSVEIYPYLRDLASVRIDPTDGIWHSTARELTMPVPFYSDGEWKLTEKQNIRIENTIYFNVPGHLSTVSVAVPPFTKVNVYTEVVYTGAEAEGHLVFLNEVLDRKILEAFKVSSLYPIKHEIRVEEAQ